MSRQRVRDARALLEFRQALNTKINIYTANVSCPEETKSGSEEQEIRRVRRSSLGISIPTKEEMQNARRWKKKLDCVRFEREWEEIPLDFFIDERINHHDDIDSDVEMIQAPSSSSSDDSIYYSRRRRRRSPGCLNVLYTTVFAPWTVVFS